MEQEWYKIPGYLGYEINKNTTEIRSVDRYIIYKKGTHKGVKHFHKGKILTPCEHEGYNVVRLSSNKVKGKIFSVGQLMILTFIGPLQKGMDVHHLDLNRKNDKLSNLIYVTRKEHQRIHQELGIGFGFLNKLGQNVGPKNGMYGVTGSNAPSSKRVEVFSHKKEFITLFGSVKECEETLQISAYKIRKSSRCDILIENKYYFKICE